MHYSYFNKGLRIENTQRSELRIYGAKIASRFFGTNADFTWSSESWNQPISPSTTYTINSNPTKYTKEIQEFLLREPNLTQVYLVIRNPLDRLKTGLAQTLYNTNKFDFKNINIYETNSFQQIEKFVSIVIGIDPHINRYHEDVYQLFDYTSISNIPSRKNEKFIIEDIDSTEYINHFYISAEVAKTTLSNKPLIGKVNELMNYIMNEKKNTLSAERLTSYLETETEYYNKLKSI